MVFCDFHLYFDSISAILNSKQMNLITFYGIHLILVIGENKNTLRKFNRSQRWRLPAHARRQEGISPVDGNLWTSYRHRSTRSIGRSLSVMNYLRATTICCFLELARPTARAAGYSAMMNAVLPMNKNREMGLEEWAFHKPVGSAKRVR